MGVNVSLGHAHVSGATPMNPDEVDGLMPRHITFKRDLDEFEQANILKAQEWSLKRVRKDILSGGFVCLLHKKMFDKTWRWAGKFRKTEKSIGVDPAIIGIGLRDLLEDVKC